MDLQLITEAYFRCSHRSRGPGICGDIAANALMQIRTEGGSARLRLAAENALLAIGALVPVVSPGQAATPDADADEEPAAAVADADADAAATLVPANDDSRGASVVTLRQSAVAGRRARRNIVAAAAIAFLAAISLQLMDPGPADEAFISIFSLVDHVPGFDSVPGVYT